MPERFHSFLDAHLAVARQVAETLARPAEQLTRAICSALDAGGRLLVFGNGGSAADAQHLAAELVGRYRRNRQPLPAIALTADSAVLTCIGNDYAFADVFARQVTALAGPGDMVMGITTSGDSENVIRGLAAGQARGAVTAVLTGGNGGRAARVAQHALVIPSAVTAHIQEMHILLIHLICEGIDDWLLGPDA